jgi:hypothetical protein
MIAPFFIHVNPSNPFVWETNTFDFVIGAMLAQLGKNNLLHQVGLRFCKFSLVKIDYEIHNKKLLAIVDAFEK